MARYSAGQGAILVDGRLLRYSDDPAQADTVLRDMLATSIVEEELNRTLIGQDGTKGVVVMYLGSPQEVLSRVGRRLPGNIFTQGGDLRPGFMPCWNTLRHARMKARAANLDGMYGAPAGIYLMASKYKGQLTKGQR